jgi:F0F1-type ATP synthase beta subunit
MAKIVHGVVHGRTIALEEDLGLVEGQAVELTIRPISVPTGRQLGEGLLRTEGALADDPYWDAIMDRIYRERKSDTRKDVSE